MATPDDPDEPTPTKLTADLCQLDRVFDDAQARRDTVAALLEKTLSTLTIDTSKPREVEVQMQLVNTYLGILNNKEASISRRVSSKLKQLDSQTASNHSAAVVDLLSKITSSQTLQTTNESVVNSETAATRIEQEFITRGLAPVLAGELKLDPNDLDA